MRAVRLNSKLQIFSATRPLEALIEAQHLDAVGRLAGGVAHDFNNLLSVINGYCEILSSKPVVRKAAVRELAAIHQAGQQAATLVRQLLAFSRREALDPRVLSVNKLVRDNATILAKLIRPNKRLVLELDAVSDRVRVDLSQLQQVLLNLALNARDAVASGGRVRIRTANRVVRRSRRAQAAGAIRPGRYVVLSVEDNGHGMDAETQAHLFEPFFTTKEQGQGTGLGLSLVFGVVQQSEGYITVQTALGEGSTLNLYLPEVGEPPAPQLMPPAILPSTRGSETLLILEEDPVVRKMVAGILTTDGYTVLAVANPLEARRVLRGRHKPIDLFIHDPVATGRAGEQLALRLLKTRARLRVLCTGGINVRRLASFPVAAQATLAKPYTLSTLILAVRALLDSVAQA
jgi:two-component system, cell cycle sensor histidine kinase and response regulator CckA